MMQVAGTTRIALGVTGLAIGLFAGGLADPEPRIGRSVSHALDERHAGAQTQLASRVDPAFLHLTSAHASAPLALSSSVRLGDRITIGGHGGKPTILEVTDVRALVADAARPSRMLLVTASSIDPEHASAVHFLVDATTPPPAKPEKPRAL